jgi:GntR family phosphonate transport system transcriptional regulator
MNDIAMNVAAADPTVPIREAGISLWRQITRTIEADIAGGRYGPGSRLPTETELSQLFGVNRHTLRRALNELSRTGLIRIEHGRGSFVADDVLDFVVGPRTRFSEWIRRHNLEPSGQVIDLREIGADDVVARALGIRRSERVVLMERLGLADGCPVGLGSHYFSAARFPDLLEALKATDTITAALARVGVADYRRQSTRVTARLPQGREAELLQISRERPVLVTDNINVDQDGKIVEYGVSRYPTPRVQIVIEP